MSPWSSSGGGGSGLPAGGATSQVVGYGGSPATGAWVFPPGYEIGYDQITAPVTVSSATESAGTTVISCAAHTFDGAAVVLEIFAPNIVIGSADLVSFLVFEGATEIGRISDNRTATTSGGGGTIGKYRFTPTAGSHTYTITAVRGTNNGTVSAGAGGTATYLPAFARFTKV